MTLHPHEPPRLPLALLPTPVVELKNLSRRLGLPRLLMKRDDLTGLETSGNKVRKLEYILADAVAKGADTLVTNGGFQSNHCRATAAVGARLGLRVRLLLRSPEPAPADVGNLFLDRLFGADVSLHSVADYNTRRKELIDGVMEEERRAGRNPYYFPVGASIPLGCWGYVRCMAEVAEYLGTSTPLDVFLPVGSSGTMAGAVLGKALLRCDAWRVFGVPVSDSVEFFQKDIRELIDKTNADYRLGLTERETPIDLIDGYIGEGYALPYPQANETLRLVARTEGIALDPTYTAKAFTGMLATLPHTRTSRPEATPLFIHTGGLFGLFARTDVVGSGQ